MEQPVDKQKHHINGLFILLAGGLLVTLGALVIFIFVINGNNEQTEQQLAKAELAKSAELSIQDPGQQVASRQEAVNSAKSSAEKARAYVQLATTYINQKEYDKAKENVDLALADKPNDKSAISSYYALSVATANVEDQIKYIELIIDNLDPNDPLYNAENQGYQTELARLKNVN